MTIHGASNPLPPLRVTTTSPAGTMFGFTSTVTGAFLGAAFLAGSGVVGAWASSAGALANGSCMLFPLGCYLIGQAPLAHASSTPSATSLAVAASYSSLVMRSYGACGIEDSGNKVAPLRSPPNRTSCSATAVASPPCGTFEVNDTALSAQSI